MTTRSVRRAPLVALAVVGALALGGCGSLQPGTASVVGGTKISRSDVNELSDAQCAGIAAAAKSQQSQTQETPRKLVVQQSLSILMDTELSLQYAESEGVSPRPEQPIPKLAHPAWPGPWITVAFAFSARVAGWS